MGKSRLFRYSIMLLVSVLVLVEGGWLYGKYRKSHPEQTARPYILVENHDIVVINQDREPKGHGKWIVNTLQSDMDDSHGVDALVAASSPIEAWLKNPTPVLHVRCQERKTEVYVITGTAANPELGLYDKFHVRLRLDKNQPITQVWSGSTDNEALFAPKSIELARRIARSDSLAFEFTPFNASPVIAKFDTRGFGEHLPRIAKACKWKV